MKRIVAIGLVLAACSEAPAVDDAGGGDAPGATYADLRWTLACDEGASASCTDFAPRDVLGFDGEHGLEVSCQRSGDSLDFTSGGTVAGEAFALELAETEVRVREGGRLYTGALGSACALANLVFTTDDDRPVVRGQLSCTGLRADGDAEPRRLGGPDGEPAVEISIYDCRE